MLVQYYLANGEEINYQTPLDVPSINDVNEIAIQYATKCPNCLPTKVFVSVRIYGNFISQFGMMSSAHYVVPAEGMTQLQITTAAGPLLIQCMPMAWDTKLFMVGNDGDFERYDVDKIFEEVVLKDCEREE